MSDLLVTRLLGHPGVYHLQTRTIGAVEIRHQRCDLRGERVALVTSRAAFNETAPQPDLSMRITTLVPASSSYEAESVAEERFEEVLDVVSHESPLSRMVLTQAGCITDLGTGRVEPRLPMPAQDVTTTTFQVRREYFERLSFEQWLFAFERSDLSTRLLRSYHWSRKANAEGNRQLRVLFRWFAMETIWTLTKNDDICPRVLWSMGFPNGSMAAAVSPDFYRRLDAHPSYRHWHNKLGEHLHNIKTLRNNSVHDGFRLQDVPGKDLRIFSQVTMLACPRVQRMAITALRSGLRSAQELFEQAPLVLEAIPHVVEDVHGTLIFCLEDPSRLPRARW